MIDHNEYYLKTIDGLGLYAQSWNNGQKPKGLICIIHGLGDHSSCFDEWARLFVIQGFAVTAFDIRGNGRSQGRRGFAASYNLLLNDISIFLKESQKIFPNIPVFIYGHSFGGNLAINYVIRKKPNIQGLITTSPWLKLYYGPKHIKLQIGKFLDYVMPWYTFSTGLGRSDFNNKSLLNDDYDKDEYLHNRISVRLYLDTYKNGLWALKNIYRVNVPFLMMFGKEDKITSHRACEEYVNNTSEKTRLIIWDNCHHNLHNEPARLKIHHSIVKWLQENCNIATRKVKADEFVSH